MGIELRSRVGFGTPFLRSLWLVGAGFLLPPCFAAPGAQNAKTPEARISIGPEALAYEDLARKLSTTGRRVICDPSLEGAAALVAFRNRSWEEVRQFLLSGLDVQATPTNSSRTAWRLRRAPSVVEREARWRIAVSAELQRRLRVRVALCREALPLAQATKASLDLEREQLADEMNRVREDGKDGSPALALLIRRYQLVSCAERMKSLQCRLGTDWLEAELARPTPDLFAGPPIPNIFPYGPIAPDQFKEEREAEYAKLDDAPFDVAAARVRVHVSSAGVMVTPYFWFLAPTGKAIYTEAPAATFLWPDPDFPKPIGQEIVQLLSQAHPRDQETVQALYPPDQAFLTSATARTEFLSSSKLPIDSLSQLVEDWSRTQDREVLMELTPGAEAISELSGEDSVSPTTHRFTLSTYGAKLPHWSWKEQEGVLFVRYPLAFLTRTVKRPFAPTFRLQQHLGERRKAETPEIPVPARLERVHLNEEELGEYYRATPTAADLRWAHPLSKVDRYRGCTLGSLDEGRAAFLGWQFLSPRIRKQVLQAESKGKIRLPLSLLTRAQFRQVVAALPLSEADHRDFWHPQFPERLAGEALLVSWMPIPGKPGWKSIGCTLYDTVAQFQLSRPVKRTMK